MRKPRQTIGNEWADFLRSTRLKTVTKKTKFRGNWPMTQANFAKVVSEKSGITISPRTYISWENGEYTPSSERMKIVRDSLLG